MTRPQGPKCVHESGVLTWLDRSAGVSAPRRAGSAAELLDAGDLFRRRPVLLIQLGTRHHPAAFRPPRRGRRTLPDHLPRLCRPLRYADLGAIALVAQGIPPYGVGIIRGLPETRGACRVAGSGRVWSRVVWCGRWLAACGSCRRAGKRWSLRAARDPARAR